MPLLRGEFENAFVGGVVRRGKAQQGGVRRGYGGAGGAQPYSVRIIT